MPKNEEARRFTTTCLCNQYADNLLPSDPVLHLDTLKRIEVIARIEPAIKFKSEYDGIYYYFLRSEYWITPTLRGKNGTYHEYRYLVILNKKLIPFKANDKLNAKQFLAIRKDLIAALGAQRTDSIKPHLLRGYEALY